MKSYSTETFQRGEELGREPCRLSAQTYNLMRVLLAREGDCVFVPIRPMQYLAVVDAEEVIFVDSQHRRWVELAWRNFRPGTRTALHDPVPHEVVFYGAGGRQSAPRIGVEFARALELLSMRGRSVRSAQVLDFGGKAPAGNDGGNT